MIYDEIKSIVRDARKEQQTKINIFHYLYDILITNDIYYSVSYGTLLGTILYNDIIPWDDDIDLVIDIKDIKLIKSLIDPTYEILINSYQPVFFRHIPSDRKLDLFISSHYKYKMYDIKEEYTYDKFKNYRVRIPRNYESILDVTYGNDWKNIAYISNHSYNRQIFNSNQAFLIHNKQQYPKLPVKLIKYFLQEKIL